MDQQVNQFLRRILARLEDLQRGQPIRPRQANVSAGVEKVAQALTVRRVGLPRGRAQVQVQGRIPGVVPGVGRGVRFGVIQYSQNAQAVPLQGGIM